MTSNPAFSAPLRGVLTPNRPLADLTWLRVGGPADLLFQPADVEDLCQFLKGLPAETPVFPMGVGSNVIVRDGGFRGAVIRLGRGFNSLEIQGDKVICGAAVPDRFAAMKAADRGLDLTFLRTIPGSLGGALRMNAGCYGTYLADVFVSAQGVSRDGTPVTLVKSDIEFGYRQTNIPEGLVITQVTLQAPKGDPTALKTKMDQQLSKRDQDQPTKDLTAGSTFRNPAGFSSTGRADDRHDLKAWKLIDDAGLRGFRLGGAQMSEKHPNFLTNADNATAKELEDLGELVRKKVFQISQIQLQWEVIRVGEPEAEQK